MAQTRHGTAYLFGIDGAYLGAYAQILSITQTKGHKINEFVPNSIGQMSSSIHDDTTTTLDITFTFTGSYTQLVLAAKVTLAAGGGAVFDGDYRVESVSHTKQTKGFVEGKMTLVKDEYLTLT